MRITGPLLVGQRVELYSDELEGQPYATGTLTGAEMTPESIRLTITAEAVPQITAEVEGEPPAGGVARPKGWS